MKDSEVFCPSQEDFQILNTIFKIYFKNYKKILALCLLFFTFDSARAEQQVLSREERNKRFTDFEVFLY